MGRKNRRSKTQSDIFLEITRTDPTKFAMMTIHNLVGNLERTGKTHIEMDFAGNKVTKISLVAEAFDDIPF